MEPAEKVAAAYRHGTPLVTLACRHMSITGPIRSATCLVEGCTLTPVIPSTAA